MYLSAYGRARFLLYQMNLFINLGRNTAEGTVEQKLFSAAPSAVQ